MSISNQKALLRDFAEKNGLLDYEFYVDDGYTGRNFNRPSFQRMIADIEAGKVKCVVTKDLSRLGRNYIEAGSYIEIFFPRHNVRYIAVTDGVDSLNRQEMDITPFKNILKINFGNYSTEGVLNSLIGSPLGYIGSEEGGELINKIDTSKSKVILIDEFEKATPSVYNFFYELLEDGVFTDRHGIAHNLDGYLIIFTSNMTEAMYHEKIPDSLKSRFDMVYHFVGLPAEEKQRYIQNTAIDLIENLEKHFGTKVEIHKIQNELNELCEYDNLRDIKRNVEDIVFNSFLECYKQE